MIAKVLIEISNINVDKTFDYIVPSFLIDKIKTGIRVKVPFNNRVLEGFVLSLSNEVDSKYDLKEVIDVVDNEPILTDELLTLGEFMKEKYYASLISCYQAMLPKALKAKNNTNISKKMTPYIVIGSNSIKPNNKTQEEILSLVDKNKKVLKKDLDNISVSSVKTLIKNNALEVVLEEEYRYNDDIKEVSNNITLTEEQKKAKKEILNTDNSVILLHGVTGSGKTILYLEIVEEMLKKILDTIFLVPEISLTPQMVRAFKKRFSSKVAVLHSGLSEVEKYDEYRKIKNGEVKIVVGARSAVFAPFKSIGAIIIDEEHTNTYKQESNPKYSTIDIAIERAKYHNALVILGSATPSLESYARAIKGVYKLVELKKRVNNRELPKVEIIDMNNEYKKSGIFSKRLIEKLKETIDRKEQAILLLNRRGYSSFLMCSNCGNTIKCPNCDITLTYHKTSNTLRCHYCGYGEKHITVCPECGEQSMKDLGVGTEKVEEELNHILDCNIVRMDVDTTTKKGAHEKIIQSFKDGEYDILLGTQMISKGLDFPNVTLVAVINADTSLMLPNYRSSEYTFQLLMQTAGRSGRSTKEGCVIIQTFNPEHYAIKYAKDHDYINFFKHEMQIRHKLSYPPYYYLVYMRVIGKDYETTSKEATIVGNKLKTELTSSIILGPTTCSVFKVNNLYRFGIVIKYKKEANLYNCINSIIDHYKGNAYIKIDIDINPNSF